MTVDRRKLFALGGLGAFAAGTGLSGAELDVSAPGITIRISWCFGAGPQPGWHVLVPDWNYRWIGSNEAMPVKWMPLDEFLSAVAPEEIT